MSTPSQTVFADCVRAAKELEAMGERKEGVSVLTALIGYLETHPADPVGSCRDMASSLRDKMHARI